MIVVIYTVMDIRKFLGRKVWVFFFSSRRRHTRFDCDWSSDVCSSDLQRFCFVFRNRGQRYGLGFWWDHDLKLLVHHQWIALVEEERAVTLMQRKVPFFQIGRASCRERV